MFISSLTIQNYRCFKEALKIEFSKGLNVIIGENNVSVK